MDGKTSLVLIFCGLIVGGEMYHISHSYNQNLGEWFALPPSDATTAPHTHSNAPDYRPSSMANATYTSSSDPRNQNYSSAWGLLN